MTWQIRKFLKDGNTETETEHPASPILGYATWQDALVDAKEHVVHGYDKHEKDQMLAHLVVPNNLTNGKRKRKVYTNALGVTTAEFTDWSNSAGEWVVWQISETP